mgnify:CR=1 FL=1
MRRFDIATRRQGFNSASGADSFFGPLYVDDMEVMPGQPRYRCDFEKVSGHESAGMQGVGIYDDAAPCARLPHRRTPAAT